MQLKPIIHIGTLILTMFVITNCKPKEYIYYYEKTTDPNQEVKVKADYNDNDFRFKCELEQDCIINDKNIVTPLSLQLVFLGKYQYYPKDLHFELYVDNKKIALTDTISYHLTTVINDRVTYFKDTAHIFNVPDLITRIKAKNDLPDSLTYFEVISVFPRYYLGNKTNPESINIKVKLIWDSGEETTETNYILKKSEYIKEEYHLPIRPYG